MKGPRVRLPYAVALGVACASETWSRVTGRPALLTRMGLKTMNESAPVTSARAEQELGVSLRPFDETVRDVLAWYRLVERAPRASDDMIQQG